MVRRGLWFVGVVGLATGAWQLQPAFESNALHQASPAAPSIAASLIDADMLARQPLRFVENVGQWVTPARFVARRGPLAARLEPAAVVLQREDRAANQGVVVSLTFEGGAVDAPLIGSQPLPGRHHFLRGSDPAGWHRNVQAFGEVVYEDLYPGIDVVVGEGSSTWLQFDVVLAAGVGPEHVVVRCDGAESLELEGDGSIAIRTGLGVLHQSAPVVWQTARDGRRRPLCCYVRLVGSSSFAFEVIDRDASLSTVIDPGLEWSTYLGGSDQDYATEVAIGPDGSVTVAGDTPSADFPTTPGVYQIPDGVPIDPFVACFDPSGANLVFSTIVNGTLSSNTSGLAISQKGVVTICGFAGTSDFPTTPGAFDQTWGLGDAFVTQLTPDGSDLIFSTFLGGSQGAGSDWPYGIILEPSGSVVIAGDTRSPDFPVTASAYDTTPDAPVNMKGDVFVSRLSPDGSSLMQSTLLGGSLKEHVADLAVDSTGSLVLCGWTGSADFPVTPGAYNTTFVPSFSEYVARFDPTLSRLEFSTFIPGSGSQDLTAVESDGTGAVTVVGRSNSADYPATPGAYDPTPNGGSDVVVTRLDPTGSSLIYSTFIGGGNEDHGYASAIDSAGAVTIVGQTRSFNFPTTAGTFDATYTPGDYDLFVSRLSPDGSRLWYSTYLGGTGLDGIFGGEVFGVAVAADGAAVVVSGTAAIDFPTTPGAYDTTYNGGWDDAVVTKLDMLPTGVWKVGSSTAGCAGPLAIGVTAMPQVGKPFGLTCTNAPPFSSQGLLLLGPGTLSSPVAAKGAAVWVNLQPVFVLLPVGSNALGAALLQGAVPASPGLAGLQVGAQFLWPSPCADVGTFSASNALRFEIQP